jgi:hypothetical protein
MSENKKSQNSNEGKGGNQKLIIAIGAVIIILLLVVIIILLVKKPSGSDSVAGTTDETQRREVYVSDDNVSEIADQLESAVDEYTPLGRYTAMMSFEWHFANGEAESKDSYVANSSGNTNDIYFDIFLPDDSENAIYESPIIPRGSEIRNIKLDRDLEPGEYECILVYHLIDDDQNTISTASFTLNIIIEG